MSHNIGSIVGKYEIISILKNKSPKKYLAKCIDCGYETEKWYNCFDKCGFCKVGKRKFIDKGNYFELELSGGDFTKIDREEYEKIRYSSWYKSIRGTVESRINNKLKKLHRVIMNAKDSDIIDHINGDKLDNRKCNLRFCTKQQNNMNKKASYKSKTGYKGIRLQGGKFVSQITLNGKRYNGGSFDNIIDAIYATNKLTEQLHGEFAKKLE